jgi:hypothetical protein
MGLIREPQDVDFYVEPRPLKAEEKKKISEYIRKDKEKKHQSGHGGAQTKNKSKHKSEQ